MTPLMDGWTVFILFKASKYFPTGRSKYFTGLKQAGEKYCGRADQYMRKTKNLAVV